jgi:ParB family chromosome partitioning protein
MKMEFKTVDVDELIPNPFQPREGFDKESISELADSLKSVGEIQPIIVRKNKKGYQIIAGERRWRAAKFAKLKEVPVLVKDTAEEDVLLESLIENLHRKDLESHERENAVYELWESGRWKNKAELGRALGKTESWVVENVSAAETRKKERIPTEISTRVIADTAALEKEERRQIIAKVQREELPAEKVREVARVVKKAPEPIKKALLKPRARITPRVAEKIIELPEKKQAEAIRQVEALRLEEEEAIPYVERFKIEIPLPPPEKIAEVKERYEELQREIKAKLESPEIKERGMLGRNWLAHVTVSGALESLRCPICDKDWKNLVWKCHDLNIKEALKLAEQKYQEAVKRKVK